VLPPTREEFAVSDDASERKPACPHPKAVGRRWGDPISEERQARLKALADQQREWVAHAEAERGDSRFTDVPLTGADVFWLASYALAELDATPAEPDGGVVASEEALRASSNAAFARGALDLSELHLEGATLCHAHLERAVLTRAHLEGANLLGVYLEGADLQVADLERAYLQQAGLERANLTEASLKRAYLTGARLAGADLTEASLEQADLGGARLEGANLTEARLAGADLTAATFDKTSHLGAARLNRASLDQVTFDSVNLTGVDWSVVPVLGDEVTAKSPRDAHGERKDVGTRRREYAAAVRANRVLAGILRGQGMYEEADHYAYRAHILQRTVLRRQRKWGRAFGSWLLDLVSGYGYRLGRSIVTYLLVVLGFAVVCYLLGNTVHPPLSPVDAVVFSLTAFHGRGFLPGEVVTLHHPLAILAAAEAVIGLLLEVTFIVIFVVAFTRRFFAW
jgi:uncharacterized protein YjbI with pentapeptide repeats